MTMENEIEIKMPLMEATQRLSSLSIVVDDFDGEVESTSAEAKMPEVSLYHYPPRPYTRQSSDAMIQKILEEAEHRKHAFWKLIDEHNAVIENLKKMEQGDCCKVTSTALRT